MARDGQEGERYLEGKRNKVGGGFERGDVEGLVGGAARLPSPG